MKVCKVVFFLALLIMVSRSSAGSRFALEFGAAGNGLAFSSEAPFSEGFTNRGAWGAGLLFAWSVSGDWQLQTGLRYSRLTYVYESDVWIGPPLRRGRMNVHMLALPLEFGYQFGNGYRVFGGLTAAMEVGDTSFRVLKEQSGIGLGAGLVKWFETGGLRLFAGPYFQSYAVIPFENRGVRHHAMEFGVKFGAGIF